MPTQARKSVRWSTITVYEFGVGIGGSAVPKHGGPAIGLAKKPKYVWKTDVDAVKGALCGCAGRRPNDDASLSPSDSDESECGECGTVNGDHTRQGRRVRWFKPLERISLLEKAGFSEKKIYRMLMESSDIVMSRRLSLRVAENRAKKQRVQ
jgi:hypothetical protein